MQEESIWDSVAGREALSCLSCVAFFVSISSKGSGLIFLLLFSSGLCCLFFFFLGLISYLVLFKMSDSLSSAGLFVEFESIFGLLREFFGRDCEEGWDGKAK